MYFSVKHAVKLLGSRYIPAVCYKLDPILEPTVREMEAKGDAKVYSGKMRFVSGVPVEIKEPPPSAPAALPAANKTFGKRKKSRDFE